VFRQSLSIGIELGERTLRVVWPVYQPGRRRHWQYREQRRNQVTDLKAWQRDLTQLLHEIVSPWADVQLFLVAPSSYVRLLTVQSVDSRHAFEAARAQLPALFPFELERAQIQYQLCSHERMADHVECLLLVAASERRALDEYLRMFWNAGWIPRAVLPASVALSQLAHTLHLPLQPPLLLMALGEERTTMAVIAHGTIVQARDVILGVRHLAEALSGEITINQERVTVSHEEAEDLLRTLGVSGNAQASATPPRIPVPTYLGMIQPLLEQFLSELHRTMAITEGLSAPQQIVLAGEALRLPGFEHWLAKQTGLPVTSLRCEELLGPEGSTAAIACGLALTETSAATLDLRPRPWRQRAALAGCLGALWKMLALLMLCFWLGSGFWQIRHRLMTRQLHDLQERRSRVQPVFDLTQDLASYTGALHQLASQGMPLAWFHQLTQGFPSAVRLTALSIDSQHQQAHLLAEVQEQEQTAEASVSAFVLWLTHAHLCRQVQLEPSHHSSSAKSVIEMALTCQLP